MLDVLLLRNVPEQGLVSMERFADALERGFEGHPRVRLRSTTMHQKQRRLALGQLDSYLLRFVRYPLAARREQAQLYHIVDQGYGHLAALLPRQRTIISCHDLMLLRAEEGVTGFRGRRISLSRFRWSVSYLRSVAHVICPSESTRRDAIRLCGVAPARTTVVPNGVDSRFRPFSPQMRAKLKAELPTDAAHTLLHVSTGDRYKNVPAALHVLQALRGRGVDLALIRAGAPLRHEERRLAEDLGVVDRILDCGRVANDRLIELYNVANVLLFPSYYEGFGWPPLEAMACGVPVVASNASGLMEVVGDAALTAAPEDHPALAAAVQRVLSDPEVVADLRRRGFERVRKFSWTRSIAGMEAVYRTVAAEAGRIGIGRA